MLIGEISGLNIPVCGLSEELLMKRVVKLEGKGNADAIFDAVSSLAAAEAGGTVSYTHLTLPTN